MKIGLVSLGCPKNVVDAEVMLGLASDAGHEITADPTSADVVVVNTCAFIDRAKEESVDAILEMAELKRTGACRKLIVTGCLGERYRDQLRAEMPEIDVVLGTGDVAAIVEAIDRTPAPKPVPVKLFRSPAEASAVTAVHTPPTYLYDASTPRVQTTPRHYAYVKVAEGCDYTCAFCIIPRLRGAYRSRDESSIVAEAEAMAARGIRELILISQDTTFFGVDRGERGALARLLHRLDAIPGLGWIRLLYLYPTTITDDVLDAMAGSDKICKYIDLPLQHASDEILRRMRRPGSRRAYDALLARVRARVPGVTLRTTFIVGFPGEQSCDVDELAGFVRDTEFDHVGVFTYSHEEDTRAYVVNDDVPAGVKAERRDQIMRLQQHIVSRRRASQVGATVRVMVDGFLPDAGPILTGRVEGQAPEIDSITILDGFDASVTPPGTFVTARVVRAAGYDLVAAPLPG